MLLDHPSHHLEMAELPRARCRAACRGSPGPRHGKTGSNKRMLVRISNHEVIAALTVAGLVNIAMASAAFHSGHSEAAEIETAHHTLIPLFGGAAAGVFLVSSRLRRLQFHGRNARRANDHAG